MWHAPECPFTATPLEMLMSLVKLMKTIDMNQRFSFQAFEISIARPIGRPNIRVLQLDNQLPIVSRFLRFRNVVIDLLEPKKKKSSFTTVERCKIYTSLLPLLAQLAPAFQGCSLDFDSRIIEVTGDRSIDGAYGFPDCGAQMAYILEGLIPIFDRCLAYKFTTEISHVDRDINGSINVAELLAIDAIKRCRRVEIVVDTSSRTTQRQIDSDSDDSDGHNDNLR